MTSTAATPQPSRLPQSPLRNTFESELWDDMANVVYGIEDDTLTIPMRTQGRLEIMAQGDLNGAGSLVINVDGTPATTSPSLAGAGSLIAIWYADVLAGNHTITLTSAALISNPIIVIRRGRTPPSA